MSKVGNWLNTWRPKNVTGGAPFYPLFVLFGLNAVDELDRVAFAVLTPEIRDAFRLNIQGILTLVALVGLAVLFIEIPLSYYADRRSRVRIMTGGASAWASFSVLTGLAPSLGVLAFARAGSGLGKSIVGPTHYSLLADYYPIEARQLVYSFHRAANSLGQFAGPLLAGFLAYRFGWRTPFILFGIPTLLFVFLSIRLRDPIRGRHERLAAGGGTDVARTEEEAPSFGEGYRILWQIRTLRRIWFSLPFLALSLIGVGALTSLYYEEVFGLNEAQRGIVAAINEPFQFVGILIGTPILTRYALRNPGMVLKILGFFGVIISGSFLVIAASPWLWLSVTMTTITSAVGAPLVAGIYATLSLAIPPKVRSLGFTLGNLWVLPGLIILPVIGGFADDNGIRAGFVAMAPIYLIGSFIIGSAGGQLRADILRNQTSSLAQAEVLLARRRGESKMLLVKGLDVGYDNVQVLFNVDFEIDEGEIVALLGTNGAGKSTLLKSISGLVEARGGAIIFDGRDMTFAPPHEIVARGVIQVPGGKGVFPTLTVEENLRIAGWLYRRDAEYLREATEKVLEYFPVLKERWTQPAGNLSGGEQQMLTLAQAFIARPKLLMIDELSLGLAPLIVEQLLRIVRAIAERGTTIILVEQSVNVALTVAESAYFMEKGEIRFHGPTSELLERPDILRSVFLEGAGSVTEGQSRSAIHTTPRPRLEGAGRAAAQAGAEGEGDGERHEGPVLEVTGLSKRFGGIQAVYDVGLELQEGQILGMIGPNGAGKTTVFDLVSGFLSIDGGRVYLEGTDITEMSPDLRARYGLGRSFQDARLFPALTVGETLALALDSTVDVKDPIAAALHLPAVFDSEAKVAKRVDELIEIMGLGAFRDKFISELSTGSRRIVDLGCVLAHDPKVLLLDEPSSGIAQRETEALGPLLVRIRDATGASLLVIEHDMPLITGIADEIMALDLGQVIARGTPEEVVNDPKVIASYLGSSEEAIARSGTVAAAITEEARQAQLLEGTPAGGGAGA